LGFERVGCSGSNRSLVLKSLHRHDRIGNAVVVGVVILALGVLALEGPPHWEELFEMVCGLWLMVSPFWLEYGGAVRTTHVVIGAFVVVLAIIELCQDHEAIEN
jgi:hypothetical protein